MRRPVPLALLLLAAPLLRGSAAVLPEPGVVTLSIVTTTDVHGDIEPREERGGLAMFGGYVRNLRAARAADGGAVLLVDSGDTFLGGIESNMSEGAIVVDAYNALRYTAGAIGNHEFDFGPVDRAGLRQALGTDLRGALKARAVQAHYPLLAANLVDEATGHVVDWPNVRPSVLIDAAGARVGIVGVMTIDALRSTLAVNVPGLRVAPLAPAVATEAARLRAAGADIVIVVAHAGGACADFSNPADLSSCDADSEIFRLARELPPGAVDAIAAGHTHQGVAHEVAGIAIVQAFAHGQAFGRIDLAFDTRARRVVHRTIYAPQQICARPDGGACNRDGESATGHEQYEGREVLPDAAIETAIAGARARIRALRATALGVVLDSPLERAGRGESALGNLFADALLEASTGADVAINNNFRGGLRADLPAGPLTLGPLYDVFPYDNRLVEVTLTGAELRTALRADVRRGRPGTLSVSGLRVHVRCTADGPDVDLYRPTGKAIAADEKLVVVAVDSLGLGLLRSAARAEENFRAAATAPVMRETVEDWLRSRGGHLDVDEFATADAPRWDYSAMSAAGDCGTP